MHNSQSAANAPGATQQKPYINNPGSVSIFPVANPTDHNFWGKLISNKGAGIGVERKIHLFVKESKANKTFLTGHVADNSESLKEKGETVNSDQPNTIVLFLNEKHIPKDELKDGEKERPYYTGIYMDEEGAKNQVSLWLKTGKQSNSEFFSGTFKESAAPVDVSNKPQEDSASNGDEDEIPF